MYSVLDERTAFRKARRKLGYLYLATIVCIVVLAEILIFPFAYRIITERFDTQLIQFVQHIANRLVSVLETHPQERLGGLLLPEISLLQPEQEIFVILDRRGQAIVQWGMGRLQQFPVREGIIDLPVEFIEETEQETKEFRVLVRNVRGPLGAAQFTFLMGKDLAVLTQQHQMLLIGMILLGSIVAAIGGFVGFFFSSYALKPVEESTRKMRQFSQDASHELKTPLSIIRTTLDLLLSKESLSDTAQEKAHILQKAYRRIEHTVDQLTRLAREEGKEAKSPLKKQPVDIQKLITEVRQEFTPLIQEKGMQVQIQNDHSRNLASSYAALKTILSNLLDNAIKYAPPHTTITISATAQEGVFTLSVRDQGPGIPLEKQKQVFERFYTQSNPNHHTPGAGIGLSIVKETAAAIEGRIELMSVEGEGSTFSLRISLS